MTLVINNIISVFKWIYFVKKIVYFLYGFYRLLLVIFGILRVEDNKDG